MLANAVETCVRLDSEEEERLAASKAEVANKEAQEMVTSGEEALNPHQAEGRTEG